MTAYNRILGNTPQSEAILGRENEMKHNAAGGVVFQITDFERLDRFLILGSEGGTYYATERTLTLENAQNVMQLAKNDGINVVNRIVEISQSGRAARQTPGIFALAVVASHGSAQARNHAFEALPKVCRTGSTLLQFVQYADAMRGWGRSMKRGIANWYTNRDVKNLTYQVLKYRNRNGWSHRDVLRKTHPKGHSAEHNTLFNYITQGTSPSTHTTVSNAPWYEKLALIDAFETAQNTETTQEQLLKLINLYDLSWEMLPTQSLNNPDVWRALLPDMPLTAMMRNLGRLSRLEVLKPLSPETKHVVEMLTNQESLKRARLHPFNIMVANTVYSHGSPYRSVFNSYSYLHEEALKNNNGWNVVPQIQEALEEAFILAFNNIEPTGLNYYLGVDVSGSMTSPMMNSPVTCQQAAAALAMTIARTEKQHHLAFFAHKKVRGFSSRFNGGGSMQSLSINAKSSLQDIVKTLDPHLPWGGTDCALPMIDATEKALDVDVFVVLTDNDTWAGSIHPTQALQQYRKKMNKPNAKLVAVGMTATDYSIADPQDKNQMNIVGFDTAMPTLIADFATH